MTQIISIPTPIMTVAFTTFRSSSGCLSKRYDCDSNNNEVIKTPAAQMTKGTAKLTRIDFSDFGKELTVPDEKTAFGYGLHDHDVHGEKVNITVEGKDNSAKHRLARTAKYFQHRPQPSICMTDHDTHPRGQSVTPDQMREIIAGFFPAFAQAAAWVRGSLSAGVHLLGEQPAQATGFHIYNAVPDGSDIPRFGLVLCKRLWLNGHGYTASSAAGTFLVRTIADGTVYRGERLDFVGKPVVGGGLMWTPPEPTFIPGGYLDTRLLSDLTAEEEAQYAALVAAAKAEAEPERARTRAEWLERQIKRMVERGAPEDRARATLQNIKTDGAKFDLYGDFLLEFASEGIVSVAHAVKNPSQYNGKPLADPFEGPAYGRTTAKFYTNNGKSFVNSHAHGGMKYFLHDSPSQKSGVPGVSGVPSNDGAGLGRNTEKNEGVPGVLASFPDEIDRPCYLVYEDWCGPEGKNRSGVYYHYMTNPKRENEFPAPVDKWLCDPLYVDAITRDHHGNNHGLMLRFRNKDKIWKLWNMPARLLDGGDELRKELLGQGLFLDIKDKQGVPVYLNSQHPKSRMRAALQVGWYGNDFVLPTRVIGTGDNGEAVFFQSDEAGVTDYSTRGSMEDWRTQVALPCTGNPLLIFGVSAAFGGPLLLPCNVDGAGFHFFGNSSKGKTTGCKAAASVWGPWKEYMRSWKATANGLEGAACLFNDLLLVLDEMSDGDAQEVEKIVYALVNGKGKQRAHVTGSAKAVRSWRILALSNGEKTLDAHLSSRGISTKAGQLVRLLQIPLFGKYGAFDDLHEYQDGKSFSDSLVASASKYYGTAGIAYLEKLTEAIREGEDISATVNAIGKLITKSVSSDLSSQEERAATAFAIVAAAGEYATTFGVTGWQPGTAIEAAQACFKHWRDHRGTGDAEKAEILTMISDFVSQWGDARFSGTQERDDRTLNGPRAGYWRDIADGGREWLLTPTGIRDAVKGFDMKRITSVLLDAGWLQRGTEKTSQSLTVRGEKSRYYVLRIPEDRGHAA